MWRSMVAPGSGRPSQEIIMPLKIYTGNRMENLVTALAGVLATPLASPFTPELIVVQSKGMQRWLAMELAKKLGIWANCKYPFPNKMVWQLFCSTLKEMPDISSFSPEVMTWKIMARLPGFLHRAEFAPLRHYLTVDSDGLKLFQLAGKIADTFDQYTLFRPEMILGWEEGRGGEWQEILWRDLAKNATEQHRARLKKDFATLLAQGSPEKEKLPERITVFGISYLPQYHLDIFAAMAEYMEINLFLLSPCREYWGDIVSAREKARQRPVAADYLLEGNPLLASLGKLARDFSNMVINSESIAVDESDLYADCGEGSLLTSIQSDILNLRGAEGLEGKRSISAADRSVQIHSCHSPLREIEVLHDNLLALLETANELAPRDIVVMTPDIEAYAPYISMVFGSSQDTAGKIPYSIADRSLASEGLVAGLLLKLLAVPGSRLTATSVFDILEALPVRGRFGLDGSELEAVRGWIEATRIRWGADEEHRAGFGLPAYRENSWGAGLERLLLGYAMPEEGGRLYHGILPFDEMEGSMTAALGKFAEFVQKIVSLKDDLAGSRPLVEWRDALRATLSDFIAQDDELAFELAAVTAVVDSLESLSTKAGFSEKVELGLIRSWLLARLAEEEKGLGFLTGGVTFCAMLPMRSIPFRVVALVGMNDNSFPRQSRPPGFDLIARNPRAGDRSLRDEDRYLFLEALLSARDYLYISYVGQSIKDNSHIPPSVLVSEFIDTIDRGFTAAGAPVEDRLVSRHRLQAFSRSYFDNSSPLFSYSRENCAAQLEAGGVRRKPAMFMARPLPEPPQEMRDVSLPQLLRFFTNPARYLLENRLQLRLEEVSTPLSEREPFAVEGLDAYSLSQELLEIRLAGESAADYLAIAKCRGLLPPARHGEAVFARASAEVAALAARIEADCAGQTQLEPLHFAQTFGEFKLSGRVDNIRPGRKIAYRCATLKAKDEIRTWLEHLVLNACAPAGYPRESLLIMKDATVTYAPVDNAPQLLEAFLDRYWQGMTMPLRFFPATSLEFAATDANFDKARRKYESGFKYTGEGEDPFVRLCFGREDDPLSGDFAAIALELLTPLLAGSSKEKA